MIDIFTKFKPLRNKIKKYDSLSIINCCIIKFKQYDHKELIEWKYFPWELLILIRWVYQYSETQNSVKIISDKEFNSCIKSIRKLRDDSLLLFSEQYLDSYRLFKRSLFVQLPFQVYSEEVICSIKRQIILFSNNQSLDEKFIKITGICIRDFLNIYGLIWNTHRDTSQYAFLNHLQYYFSKDQISKFFCATSLNFSQAQRYIREYSCKYEARKRIDYQINEHSPLERYPFFKDQNENYNIYSLKLMENSLQTNIYDIFKENNPNFSGDDFGIVFEEYIAKGLKYYGRHFLREKEIQSFLEKKTKCADFLIKENSSLILIDAKSTEINSVAKVLQSKDSILKNMETNIINGIIQIITTAYHCNKIYEFDNEEIYGVIVTYKNYLIGNSNRFIEDIIGDEINSKIKKLGIINYIPSNNWFFISIDEFDLLVSGAKEKNLSISNIFSTSSIKNNGKETSAFMLKQHLFKFFDNKYHCPTYVSDIELKFNYLGI